MLNIAICDDNPLHIEDIKEKTSQILSRIEPAFEISAFASAEELLSAVDGGKIFRLLFLT